MSESDGKAAGPDLALGVAVGEVPEGRLVAGSFAGEPVVLTQLNGRFCAWRGTCTHMGASLSEGLLVDGQIRCPWHHARFSLRTGEAVGAPAFAALAPYTTSVTDGRVFVAAMPTHGEPGAAPAKVKARPVVAPTAAARVVIIGAGAGGVCVRGAPGPLRVSGTVTLVGDDPDASYDRTVCSKQYLIGMTSRQESLLPPAAGVRIVRGRAESIDVVERSVRADTGEPMPFDVLVLATGAAPLRPRIPGFEAKNVYVLRTLQDADAVIAAAASARRVAIIGASFIGLEVAASLRQRKLEVHVVAADDVPLKKLVGAEVGRMIRMVHEEKGVVFHLGRKPKMFEDGRLILDDGSILRADFLVLGMGVRPCTEIAERAGIDCASPSDGGGVLVDGRLETSMPGIFAIGDIARYPDVHVGTRIRVEHWVHAQRQGQHVARAIMGETGVFRDLPFFWSAPFRYGP